MQAATFREFVLLIPKKSRGSPVVRPLWRAVHCEKVAEIEKQLVGPPLPRISKNRRAYEIGFSMID
jgi:hypothetical protein